MRTRRLVAARQLHHEPTNPSDALLLPSRSKLGTSAALAQRDSRQTAASRVKYRRRRLYLQQLRMQAARGAPAHGCCDSAWRQEAARRSGRAVAQVRVRMQQAAAPWPSAAACIRATVGREGPGALLRGLSYPLATISVQARRSSCHAVWELALEHTALIAFRFFVCFWHHSRCSHLHSFHSLQACDHISHHNHIVKTCR